jgi:hypothetical protein
MGFTVVNYMALSQKWILCPKIVCKNQGRSFWIRTLAKVLFFNISVTV